jgi:hypothetical protein
MEENKKTILEQLDSLIQRRKDESMALKKLMDSIAKKEGESSEEQDTKDIDEENEEQS